MPGRTPIRIAGPSETSDLPAALAAAGWNVVSYSPDASEDPPAASDSATPRDRAVARARRRCRSALEMPPEDGIAAIAVGLAHAPPPAAGEGMAAVAVVAVNGATGEECEVVKEVPDTPDPGVFRAPVEEALKECIRNVRVEVPDVPSWKSLDLSKADTETPRSPQHGLAEVLQQSLGAQIPEPAPADPVAVEAVIGAHSPGVNCRVPNCMSCGASFDTQRRIWCPKCNATVCADCCSSPVLHVPRTRPAANCRACAKQSCQRPPTPAISKARISASPSVDGEADAFRLKSTREFIVPEEEDTPADDEACEGCGAPFSFFRPRRSCAQCARVRCAKCLVQKPHSPDVTKLCNECLYGPEFSRRRVGIDPTVPGCLVCAAGFSLFRRRHWCRRCGRTICSSCSSTPISGWLRRHPKCICKRCFVPKIFRLPYDLAQYMMEFVDQDGRTAANRVCKRFHRLVVLPFNAINKLDDYFSVDTKKDLLGEGAFGMVYSAVCKRTGEPRAIKVISKKKLATYEKVRILQREIDIHSQLDHPNTVPLYEVMQTNTEVFLVMGRAGKYDLVDYLLSRHRVPEQQVIPIAVQVLQFLHYLHADKFAVHRDLKLDNVMMSQDDGHVLVRVIDFGLAKQVGPPPDPAEHTDPINFMKASSFLDYMGSTAPADWSPLPAMTPPANMRMSSSPHDSHSASPPSTSPVPGYATGTSPGSPGGLQQGVGKSRSRSPRRRESGSLASGRRSDVGVLCTPCGTLRYCAPEVLAVRSHHQKVPHVAVFKRDIFSLGVLLYALLCGRLPYECNTVRQLRREMARPLSFRGGEDLSSDCKAFIASLCTLKPYYRPSAHSALTHSWLMGAARLQTPSMTHAIQSEFRRRRNQEREKGIEHDRPFMHLHVEEDETGSVVAQQMQLSGYFSHTRETVAESEMEYRW